LKVKTFTFSLENPENKCNIFTKVLSSTGVFNIDNNKKYFQEHIRMISEESGVMMWKIQFGSQE